MFKSKLIGKSRISPVPIVDPHGDFETDMENGDLKIIKGFVDNLNIEVDKHPNVETHFWKGKYGDILAIVNVFGNSTQRRIQCHITASGQRCLSAASKQSA